MVGEEETITYRVEEKGFSSNTPLDVIIRLDGEIVSIETVLPNQTASFTLEIPHAGQNIIELEVAEEPGEITTTNNRTFATLNGIRKNLRVLLISGEPHAGERTWRNLLKSDASVDLVHFTILRPPEKQDGTPINQLSLIAFPTRELFILKIQEFDLIIFDRYKRRDILPILYYDNIARYVEEGGALLMAVGPEYAEPNSISYTPLNNVLPALSDGTVREDPFKPLLSELGQKHPVTRDLEGWNKTDPKWSRWFRSIGVNQVEGEVLMQDEAENPLLVLGRRNEGRVALFLSDHVWLWSRGFEGGGPHTQLLRRLSHWLMKEPELEEEQLSGTARGNKITLKRQSIEAFDGTVELTSPSGENSQITLKETQSGIWESEINAEEIGLYTARDGEFSALMQVGPANPRELAQALSTTELVGPVTDKTSGSVMRMEDGELPNFIPTSQNSAQKGNGWIGFPRTTATELQGISRIELFSGLLGLAILLLAISATWLREGRRS